MHHFLKSQHLKIKVVVALVKCLDTEPLLADGKNKKKRTRFSFPKFLAVGLNFRSVSL